MYNTPIPGRSFKYEDFCFYHRPLEERLDVQIRYYLDRPGGVLSVLSAAECIFIFIFTSISFN